MTPKDLHPEDCSPLGDSALLLHYGTVIDAGVNLRLHQAAEAILEAGEPCIVELVPSYTGLAVHYDPCAIHHPQPFVWMAQRLYEILDCAPVPSEDNGRELVIPVCYGGEYGPDLDVVARHSGLGAEQVIQRHGEARYRVYFIGFSPGFPFLGGLDPVLATPRRDNPRLEVPAGSVGIAGAQTGIYPQASPGGWQIIGRTPLPLVDFGQQPPSRLQPGDRIRFEAVSAEQFLRWREAS